MRRWNRWWIEAGLARRLGPWADATARPPGVTRREVTVPAGERPFPAWIYRPTRPRGALLLVPGLHYLGPADPRLDRFAAVLAAAGLWVLAPFLPDFRALVLDRRLLDDVAYAFDACLAAADRPPGRLGVMSISFGSLPALSLAARRSDELAGVLVFGGYADVGDALRFCLHGAPGVPRDPLNAPVVFLNLLEHLPVEDAGRERLAGAWRRFVEATWGRPEMKAPDRWPAVARALAAELPAADRPLFLTTCGVEPGGAELLETALAAARDRHAWLDPRPHLAAIRCPVHVVHGAEDDVIPWQHARRLYEALPPAARAGLHVTGLYDHTGHSGAASLREARTLLGILRAITATAGL